MLLLQDGPTRWVVVPTPTTLCKSPAPWFFFSLLFFLEALNLFIHVLCDSVSTWERFGFWQSLESLPKWSTCLRYWLTLTLRVLDSANYGTCREEKIKQTYYRYAEDHYDDYCDMQNLSACSRSSRSSRPPLLNRGIRVD